LDEIRLVPDGCLCYTYYGCLGTTAQFGGASGDVFSAICGMQISRFIASKPLKFAFASDEKSIRQPTTSFVRCYLYWNTHEPAGIPRYGS
jgi:hypothetical protein